MTKEHRYVLGKVDELGTGKANCEAAITWSLDLDREGRFSMCAEIWLPNKRDLICGGQCVDYVAGLFPDDAKAQRMAAIWKDWHLNDMRAGTPEQRAFLMANGLTEYSACVAALDAAGLNDGYKYGSAWLMEKLPLEIAFEIQSWSQPAKVEA